MDGSNKIILGQSVMIVENNFMGSEYCSKLEEKLLSNSFPWFYFNKTTLHTSDQIKNLKENSYVIDNIIFRHSFIKETKVQSGFIELIAPLLYKVVDYFDDRDCLMYGVHANLQPVNSSIINKHTLPHVDVEYDQYTKDHADCYTGVYYFHNCDGETILYNESVDTDSIDNTTVQQRFTPEKDKLVLWNSHFYHSAPASASIPRSLINLNFCVKRK